MQSSNEECPTESSANSAGTKPDNQPQKAKTPGPDWHGRFLQQLAPQAKVWLSLCDLTRISTSVYCYVESESFDSPPISRRKFSHELKRNMKTALSTLEKARKMCLHRFGDAPPKLDQAMGLLREQLGLLQPLLNARRLGVGNPVWILVLIEAYIERFIGRTPPPKILSHLVQAGRKASGQPSTSWDSAENIGKNLRNFKRRNDNATLLKMLPLAVANMSLYPNSTQIAKPAETKPAR